ncbi:MAG: DUF692 family protein [Chloroflexi bacterium]|nr:DUF692 family protein [Chloroflexota bacterium]
MNLSINYSRPLAALVRDGRVTLDRFKCPAWPDLIAEAQGVHAAYVHFPLAVGYGRGIPYDFDERAPADLERIERLLVQTGTPFVNVHLGVRATERPDIPPESDAPAHRDRLVEAALSDMRPLLERFGAERIMIENDHAAKGTGLRLTIMPETFHAIVRETNCGFLLDLSHARLAAKQLGADARTYTEMLPVGRLREIHVTGMQVFGEALATRARQMGVEERTVAQFAGQWMDHLPMTEIDYEHLAWALGQVRAGAWAEPWSVSHEVGGVGSLWETIAEATPFLDEAPRLYALVHKEAP